jgi:hypothetical protein
VNKMHTPIFGYINFRKIYAGYSRKYSTLCATKIKRLKFSKSETGSGISIQLVS